MFLGYEGEGSNPYILSILIKTTLISFIDLFVEKRPKNVICFEGKRKVCGLMCQFS